MRPRNLVLLWKGMCEKLAPSASKQIPRRRETPMVDFYDFYWEYHGHKPEHLTAARSALLRDKPDLGFVYFLGDSSLDNKHWILPQSGHLDRERPRGNNIAPACNGWEHVVAQGRMVEDVAYHLNAAIAARRGTVPPLAALNCAVEESTVGARAGGRLLPQDAWCGTHLTARDTLVVSLGGNDIALRPSGGTICNITTLMMLGSASKFEAVREDSGGGGASRSLPCGMAHFVDLFGAKVQAYIERVLAESESKQLPKRIIVCMIYFLDEEAGGSWADTTLKLLGYNTNPAKLQALIRTIFELATRAIAIEGVEVVGMPLFEVLDGKDHGDYVARVEPSSVGGRKIAEALLEVVLA